jgi:hypothetical protein
MIGANRATVGIIGRRLGQVGEADDRGLHARTASSRNRPIWSATVPALTLVA